MKLYRRFSIKEIEFGINFVKQTTYTIQSIGRLMYSAITNRWSYGKKKAKQFIEKAKEVISNNKNKTQFNPSNKPKNKFMNFIRVILITLTN
jgi:tyrosine-protein phosphatase YwqE